MAFTPRSANAVPIPIDDIASLRDQTSGPGVDAIGRRTLAARYRARNQLARPLSDEQLERFNKLAYKLTREIPYCPVVPNPGPQTLFLLDFGMESLYGGAAGGGKSFAILMAASQFLDIPGYHALILRKSFADLTKADALMDIAKDWWGPQKGTRWHAQEKYWSFVCPGGGESRVYFGALDEENDRFKYQGGAYHFIGWDELTQQKERDYTYVSFSRVRRPSEGPLRIIPMRIRSTANPGGQGHDWVNKRFIVPYKMWKFRDGKRPKRNFHPANIDDNPKLDREAYNNMLMELDPVTRAQLMKGDWEIRPDGRMFRSRWFKTCKLIDVPKNCMWVRFWDMAATEDKPDIDPDYTAGCLLGRSPGGQYYILDMRHWREDPAQLDLMLKCTAYFDTGHVPIRMEQEPAAGGKIAIHHYRTNCFDGFDFHGIPAVSKGSKTMAAAPVASQADAGNVYMVEADWNEEFLDEVEIFPDGLHDDMVDALSGAFRVLSRSAIFGLKLGDGNSIFVHEDSGWRPDATPNFTWQDANGNWGDIGKGEEAGVEEPESARVAMDDRELDGKVARAWEM